MLTSFQPFVLRVTISHLMACTLTQVCCQVEVIELVNDGTGLGFGIIGGQQTGVVVKTILPGGVADRDTRLLPGDFILQINQHWLRGVASEQVLWTVVVAIPSCVVVSDRSIKIVSSDSYNPVSDCTLCRWPACSAAAAPT